MGLKDFDASKLKNFRYDSLGAESKTAQSFEDQHSGTTVTGQRDMILEKFLDGDPLSVKSDATIFDNGVGSIAIGGQTFTVNNSAGLTTITGQKTLLQQSFLQDSLLESKNDATIFDDTVGSGTVGQNYVVRHSNFQISGDKKPIGSLIDGVMNSISQATDVVSAGLETPEEAAAIIGASGMGFGQVMIDIPEIPTPQSYDVVHRGGTKSVTGLKGSIMFDGLDDLKSKSILVSTWANLVDSNELFSYTNRQGVEGYPGHNENVVKTLNFGVNSVDSNPERIFTQSPRIGYTVQGQRGGANADKIAENYANLVGGAGNMFTRFLDKRSERQSMYAIMKGSQDPSAGFTFDATFSDFDAIGLQAGFYPGIRGVSIGSFIFGAPSYIDNTPRIDTKTYSGITDKDFVGSNAGDMEDFDPNKNSKMLFLYQNFILREPDQEQSGGFMASLAAFWDNTTNPYPIVPSQNVVQSIPYTDLSTKWHGGTEGSDGEKKAYIEEAFNGEIEGEDDGFQFYSRFKPTTQIYDNLESKLAEPTAKWEFEGPEGGELFPKKGIPQVVERSRKGDQSLNKYNVNANGLAHKYATLGYTQLDATNKYENSLVSPSEQLSGAQREILQGADIIKHLDGTSPESLPVASKGSRWEGRQKVYAIGKQGAKLSTTLDTDLEGPFAGSPVKKVGTKYFYDGVDKVNSQFPSLRTGKNDGGEETIGADSKDFIPLNFYDIHNDTDIPFRALFDGDITDNITPTWTPSSFVGRPVAGYTYQGTERTLSFGFDIYPKTKQEFPVLLEKVNYLVGLCYPNLDSFYRMSGPMIRLTVGDIVHDQMGFLTECSVTFPEDSTWETDEGLRFTKRINISLGFQYIGDNLPLNKGIHYNLNWLNNDGTGQTYEELINEGAAGAKRSENKIGKWLNSAGLPAEG